MTYIVKATQHNANFVGASVAYRYPDSWTIHLFYRGSDNRLYHNQKDTMYGIWLNWDVDKVGLLAAEPAICATGPNDLHVFVQGTDGQLWHKWRVQVGPWSAWEALGGKLIGRPAAISRNMVVMDIFVRGTDNNLYQKSWDGRKWLEWIRLDNRQLLSSSPTVCSTGPEGLNLFWRTVDGQLWHKPWTGERGWHGGEPLGGQIIVDPCAISYRVRNNIVPIDVFAVGTDGMLFRREWTGSIWLPWKLGLEPWLSGNAEARQNVYGGVTAVTGGDIPHFFIGQKNQIIKELMLYSVSDSQAQPQPQPVPPQPAPVRDYAFCITSFAGSRTEYISATSAGEADKIMNAMIRDLNSRNQGGTGFSYRPGACV